MGEIRRAWRPAGAHGGARPGRSSCRCTDRSTADEQDRALRPSDRRKIILSTNIAETSLTIEGVRTVIDSGLVAAGPVRPRARGGPLVAGADQPGLGRAAGRPGGPDRARGAASGSGRQRDERAFPAFEEPEIRRVDLAGTLLAPALLGPERPVAIPMVRAAGRRSTGRRRAAAGRHSGPSRASRRGSRRWAGGSSSCRSTPGWRACCWPPRTAAGSAEGAAVAALLSEKDIRARDGAAAGRRDRTSSRRTTAASDVLVRLDLLAEAESARFSPSLEGSRHRSGRAPARSPSCGMSCSGAVGRAPTGRRRKAAASVRRRRAILKWLLLAYPDRVVKRRGAEGTGLMVGGRGVRLAPGSVVRDAELYLALDAREDRRGGRREVHAFLASAVAPEWLEELHPEPLRREQATVYDAVAEEGRRRRAALVSRSPAARGRHSDPGPARGRPAAGRGAPTARLEPRAATIPRSRSGWRGWTCCAAPCRSWAGPIRRIDDRGDRRGGLPGEDLARGDRADGPGPAPGGRGSIGTRPASCARARPESLALPSGRRVRLVYETGRPPVLAARLQELFGWPRRRAWPAGGCPVLLQILGPNHRPVQVTDDLHSFWTTTYFQVRKDLRGRYPKHSWPDEPLKAQPPVARTVASPLK